MLKSLRKYFTKGTRINWVVILLLGSVVLSSFSWKVNFHICGQQVINYALYSEAEGCGMTELESACNFYDDKESVGQTCCINRNIVFEGVDNNRQDRTELNPESVKVKNHTKVPLVSVVDLKQDRENPVFESPPWTTSILRNELQVFLI